MILTKKEAIRMHRAMWRWIAIMLKSERYKCFKFTEVGTDFETTIDYLKTAYVNMIGRTGEVAFDCFCCDYTRPLPICGARREICPVVWSSDDGCSYGEYNEFSQIPYAPENLDKAAALALKIANLPERED